MTKYSGYVLYIEVIGWNDGAVVPHSKNVPGLNPSWGLDVIGSHNVCIGSHLSSMALRLPDDMQVNQ